MTFSQAGHIGADYTVSFMKWCVTCNASISTLAYAGSHLTDALTHSGPRLYIIEQSMASSQFTHTHKRQKRVCALVTRKVLCYKRGIALQRLTAHGSCSSGDRGGPQGTIAGAWGEEWELMCVALSQCTQELHGFQHEYSISHICTCMHLYGQSCAIGADKHAALSKLWGRFSFPSSTGCRCQGR